MHHFLTKPLAIITALSLSLIGKNVLAVSNNETESNNSIANANTISLSTDLYGTISSTSDQDWYKFTPKTSGTYNIGLLGIPQNADYDMALYKSSSSNCLKVASSKNRYESISYSLVANTTYYIKIYSVSGFSTTEKYRLRISNTEQAKEGWLYCFRGQKMA